MKYDFLIVGAGFAGAVCAERLAASGKRVLVVDKRNHIGGNAFDRKDENGVLVHPYGPHIFHTNSKRIFEYLSCFTDWRFYEHRVKAYVDGDLYPMPINRTTINKLYGLDLSEQDVIAFLESVREERGTITTSEDLVLNNVGHDLCNKFFRGYTRKQWGLDLSELSAGVAARIPTRSNDDDRYFTDTFQFMPAQGYSAMFEKMLDSSNIEVRLSTDYNEMKAIIEYGHLVYTGPIDAYFGYCFGKLPYRSLDFQHQHLSDVEHFQPTGTINYPNDQEYTRITEFKYLTGQQHPGTSIVKEYPRAEGEPYYPIPRKENEALFMRYSALAEETADATFVGRLAQYRYYNMDQVVGAALKAAEGLI
ncbi:UDP-galactopyranose mutase [Caballeronia arvi]|uniref:UDP-galactopyranose mutase n=1 Tax=Caballeronia arvi TaxID=1777135 RepID=A0A158EPG6_9BURK|nr:UDP-galactopyranose mutase [Caballeronia arvi]SAL09458.1 UDP-galactopyranose mutase [Caballeronia arvi]